MKKAVVFLVIVVLPFGISNAEETSPKFSIQAYPMVYGVFSHIFGDRLVTADIEFRYLVNDYFIIFINPKYVYNSQFVSASSGGPYNQKFIETYMTPGILFAPFKSGLEGIFIGAYVPIGWLNWQRDEYIRETSALWNLTEGLYDQEVVPAANANFF